MNILDASNPPLSPLPSPLCSLRSNVLAAKQRLAEGLEACRRRHEAGVSGVELCFALSDLRDAVLRDLAAAALEDLGLAGLQSQIALVAHGGYGRREVAPYSDVDLMLLHRSGVEDQVARLAEQLLRDVFDAGLCLGHSVRTPKQAWQMACIDPTICTSLVESRLLGGSNALFARYMHGLRRRTRRGAWRLMAGIVENRLEERLRYGETAFLLEPNVKRTQGTLRDLQLIRWIGFIRYGTVDFAELRRRGALTDEDLASITPAVEFLLRLRNELHFHANGPNDVLDRADQLRIAEQRGYAARDGLLPVEQFMRDYFRHTAAVGHIAQRVIARAQSHDRLARLSTALFGHRVEEGVHVGPAGIMVARRRRQKIAGDLTEIIRLVDLANLYDKPIATSTWEAIRQRVGDLPDTPPTPEACRRFLSLLGHPARLGPLLRDLHDARLLERFIPAFQHARGLLQFNQYHKYTVDEHCLRAVEFATRLWSDAGPLGRVYRPLEEKRLLHLALLIHDLGKGRLEDHREVGVAIASEVAERLGLNASETQSLRFLVHKHMLLNHLAFRRDTADEQLAVQLAVQVGSPKLLQMLYLLTAADLGAVGPDVWDGWKQEVITELYHRTMQHLAGESPETTVEDLLARRREEVVALLSADGAEPWFGALLDALPTAYLNATAPRQIADDLRLLHGLSRQVDPADALTPTVSPRERESVAVAAEYLPATGTVELTIATTEQVATGIFHRITGVLGGLGLEIRTARIHTLPDGRVLDRFSVHDPDYAGQPPSERLDEVRRSLVKVLQDPTARPPVFRRTWQLGAHRPVRVPGVPTQVSVDNDTSARFTIIDVFTHDRPGLLYAVTRALFELELSVGHSKIGTFLDQVVDVFYVTDRENRKIGDPERLEAIRQRLLEVVQRQSEQESF